MKKKDFTSKQKKYVVKKIKILTIASFCLFVLQGVYIPQKPVVYHVVANKIDQQTERKIAGMVNGELFFQEELDVYIAELRAVVAAHYGQKYNLAGTGADFWNTQYDDTTPREFINQLALNYLARDMMIMQEARIRGIHTPQTYNDLEKEREAWNTPTDEVIFGPKTLGATEYNNYRITGISNELKTTLLKKELAPTAAQLKTAFDHLSQETKTAPYMVSGICFRWNSDTVPDTDIRADIEHSLRQGISPEETVHNLSFLYLDISCEKFAVNSRYISKEDNYEQKLADILRKTASGSCVSGPENRSELYYVTQKEGGGFYTFEQMPELGRNKWINDQFELFLDEKMKTSDIVLFAETTSVKPIYLSKHSTIMEAEGTGTLKSRGKATASGAITYYIDFNNGNDENSGTAPLQAWKTFKNVNLKTFYPGDHILLEANSIWNGTPVDNDNCIVQMRERGNGGMLAPLGSGVSGKPCVIDLYEIKETADGITVYWSADKRPVINGNGTPSLHSEAPYSQSGAIHIAGQDYWEIRNIEVTNSFDFPKIGSNPSLLQTHWYKREVPKSLAGILVASTASHSHCQGILIENCYAHDVQSLHNNNRPEESRDWYASEHFGFVVGNPGKSGGGILFAVTESVIQGNIVRRTALEGLRTIHGGTGEKIVIRGNYVETVAGDGIVISRVDHDNLVESNVVKDACAAPNLGVGNYAANWAYMAKNTLFQYNESWGTLYGYLDGEAWDVDNDCDQVIYQYNYSHHNSGGAILFMGSQTNSIFRYNISANDGGGCKYMETVVSSGQLPIDREAQSYKSWNNGQSLIHYTITQTIANPRAPLVHNNTFYLGDGVSASIYGNTTSGNLDKYVRFYNNIILKTGAGEVRFSDTHKPDEMLVNGNILNPTGFKNNLLYAYTTDRKQDDKRKFLTGNITMDQWIMTYGNIWADPILKIQETDAVVELRKQRDDHFSELDYANSDKLKEYTDISRLRMRASLFTPLADSPTIETGMKIPTGNSVEELDGAWNGNIGTLSVQPVHWDHSAGIIKDMFGNRINSEKPPIGGAVKAYP